MAADQERADRIKALKNDRPDLTWRRIAEYVGVSERAAADWARKGGMEYDNAKKLAKLLEVDVDYIWRGPNGDTPSPFEQQDSTDDRLDKIEQGMAERTAEVKALLEATNEQLALQAELLARIEAAIAREQAVRDEAQAATRDLLDAVAESTRVLRAGTPHPAEQP